MDNSEKAALVYDKIAEVYDKEFSDHSDYLDEFLELVSEKGRILDVGCGTGVDALYTHSKGFQVTGIDLSEGMIKIAKEKIQDIDFRLGDIRNLNFNPETFDGIVSSCSLIHIPKKDIPEILKKFHQILKMGGVIYIALQAGKPEEIFIDEPFKPDEKLFLNVFSYEEIKALLERTGFSIIRKHEREPESEEELNYTKLYIIAKKA